MSGAFRHLLSAAEVGEDGRDVHLSVDEAERAGIARQLGVDAVLALAAELRVTVSRRKVARVTGRLTATVRQACVVTLDPVTREVAEEVDVTLVPPGHADAPAAAGHGQDDADPPDVYEGGVIDLGAIVTEFLALGIDPYPKAPGVEFSPHFESDDDGGDGPFGALRRLRHGNGS